MTDAVVGKIFYDLNQIDFLHIIIIISISWLFVKFVERVLPVVANKVQSRFRLYILPWVPILRLATTIIATLLIVPLVIVPTLQNLVAIMGAIGLAVGFAFKDYISSLIAGIIAIFEQPYRPGDWVQVDNAYGEVKSIGFRAVRILTLNDTVVVIPHTKIWDTNIYNANTGKRDLLCIADFYLHPTHDAVLVRQKLHDVALTSPYLKLKNPISVIVAEKPWYTHYQLKAYPMDAHDQAQFTSDLTVRGKASLAKMGIKLAAIASNGGKLLTGVASG